MLHATCLTSLLAERHCQLLLLLLLATGLSAAEAAYRDVDGNCLLFPGGPWQTDVSAAPVHPKSRRVTHLVWCAYSPQLTRQQRPMPNGVNAGTACSCANVAPLLFGCL